MKKIFALLALASVSMGSFAQDVVPEEKYSIATNSFGSNWFVQAGLDWNAWYSAEERGHDLSKSPFKKFRSNPGISWLSVNGLRQVSVFVPRFRDSGVRRWMPTGTRIPTRAMAISIG